MGVKRRLGEKPVEDTAETGKMTHRDGCLRLVDIFFVRNTDRFLYNYSPVEDYYSSFSILNCIPSIPE